MRDLTRTRRDCQMGRLAVLIQFVPVHWFGDGLWEMRIRLTRANPARKSYLSEVRTNYEKCTSCLGKFRTVRDGDHALVQLPGMAALRLLL